MASDNETRVAALKAAAALAEGGCYPRYSGFKVLAAVERTDGRVYGGGNLEVVNFSLTKHAEETAVMAAIADGALALGDRWIAAVYTVGAPPCGSCRQFLWEWAAVGATCFVDGVGPGREMFEIPLATLFPEPFEPETLPDRRLS